MCEWNKVEDYHIMPSPDGKMPFIIFGCEHSTRYRIQIERLSTGDGMYFDLTPRQALDLAHKMFNFYKRATGK